MTDFQGDRARLRLMSGSAIDMAFGNVAKAKFLLARNLMDENDAALWRGLLQPYSEPALDTEIREALKAMRSRDSKYTKAKSVKTNGQGGLGGHAPTEQCF